MNAKEISDHKMKHDPLFLVKCCVSADVNMVIRPPMALDILAYVEKLENEIRSLKEKV